MTVFSQNHCAQHPVLGAGLFSTRRGRWPWAPLAWADTLREKLRSESTTSFSFWTLTGAKDWGCLLWGGNSCWWPGHICSDAQEFGFLKFSWGLVPKGSSSLLNWRYTTGYDSGFFAPVSHQVATLWKGPFIPSRAQESRAVQVISGHDHC